MADLIERACKACGAKLVFAEGPNGRAIPLQNVRTVYAVAEGHAKVLIAGGAYVSHFETCSNPNRFSGKGQP